MISELEKQIAEIEKIDWVDEAFLDSDTAPEGELTIRVVVKEDYIKTICEQLGYNVEDWDE